MELRLPMQGGIEPLRPLELTLSAMTRSWVWVLLHETPCQLQKFWESRASLSVSVSSLIANGREHEMMKTAKSGMNFGHGANKRIILLFMCKPDFLIHLNMPHYPNQEMESILVPVVAREEVHPLDEIFETSPVHQPRMELINCRSS
uniref:Uncharacterized protein n=1 Tax=Oryza meridionalis TaxID=40149 RepID=A0A0E0CHS1_9ORYZ